MYTHRREASTHLFSYQSPNIHTARCLWISFGIVPSFSALNKTLVPLHISIHGDASRIIWKCFQHVCNVSVRMTFCSNSDVSVMCWHKIDDASTDLCWLVPIFIFPVLFYAVTGATPPCLCLLLLVLWWWQSKQHSMAADNWTGNNKTIN